MSQITRVPFGLQDLIGAKNFGRNPSELGGMVSPTLDMVRFLSAERRFFHVANTTAYAADGTQSTVTVPVGELWLVEAVGAQVARAGGGPGSFYTEISVQAVDITNSNSAVGDHAIAHLGAYTGNGNSASGVLNLAYDFPNHLVLFGDEVLEWVSALSDFSGGRSYTCGGFVRYIKLTV